MIIEQKLQKYRAIFFDLDGTLCDTAPDIKGAWRNLFARLGIVCPAFENIFRIGPPLNETVEKIFPDRSSEFRQDMIRKFGECYDSSGFPLTVPYPGIETLLQELKMNRRMLFVVTNKREKPTRLLVEKMRWGALFTGICTPDQTTPPKSKADLIHALLVEHHIALENAVMIGDTAGDIRAAKANGTASAGVTWGYGTRQELEVAGADMILNKEDFESGEKP